MISCNGDSNNSTAATEYNNVTPSSENEQTFSVEVVQVEGHNRIRGAFQTCPDGMTYTYDGQWVTEIEKFSFLIEKTPDRPDRIEQKNGISWMGQITVSSASSRKYDILNDCWSKYDYGVHIVSPLSNESGSWLPLSAFDGYQPLSCDQAIIYRRTTRACS